MCVLQNRLFLNLDLRNSLSYYKGQTNMIDSMIQKLSELAIKFKSGEIGRSTYKKILEELKKKEMNENRIKGANKEGNRLP